MPIHSPIFHPRLFLPVVTEDNAIATYIAYLAIREQHNPFVQCLYEILGAIIAPFFVSLGSLDPRTLIVCKANNIGFNWAVEISLTYYGGQFPYPTVPNAPRIPITRKKPIGPRKVVKGHFTIRINSLANVYACLLGPSSLVKSYISQGDVVIEVSIFHLRRWAFFLAKHTAFRACMLIDIILTDRPEFPSRFTFTYLLYSIKLQSRVRLRTSTNTRTPSMTLVDLFANSS
jgi:hypothetical protein